MSISRFAIHFLIIFVFTNVAIAQPVREPIKPLPLLTPMQALTQSIRKPCDANTAIDATRELAGTGDGYSVLERAQNCAVSMAEGALPDVVGTASLVGSAATCVRHPIDCLSGVGESAKATVTGLTQINNLALGTLGHVLGAALPPILCSLLGGLLARAALAVFTAGVGAAAIGLLIMAYIKKITILAKMMNVINRLQVSAADFLKMLEGMPEKSLEKLFKMVDTPEGVERAKDIAHACMV